MLVSIADDGERFRDLWADEDAELAASERAIADGVITIEEIRDVDLASSQSPTTSSAIAVIVSLAIVRRGHPMALHNATDCFRLLVLHGRRFQFVDRYESWVQYRSRRPLRRVDMRPLAEQLSNSEREAQWNASVQEA